MTTSFPFLLFP